MKTTAEIRSMLQKAGVACTLEEPPHNYVAVLLEEGRPKGITRAFQTPNRGEQLVILELLSEHLGAPLIHGEITDCTLEAALLDLERENDPKGRLTLRGDELRYALALTDADRKAWKGRRIPRINWQSVNPAVSIEIFRRNPPAQDNDPKTLEINQRMAVNGLNAAYEAEERIILAAQERQMRIKNALETLEPKPIT